MPIPPAGPQEGLPDELWVFGYGSLVWRPAFPYRERRPAYIEGYLRRFWQASPDHRGTPDAPGRVVTLLPSPGARCWGAVYALEAEGAEATLAALDHREKAGYERVFTPAYDALGQVIYDRALVYVAGADNPNFVGPAPEEVIAEIARDRAGPSGTNREYVLRLHAFLTGIGAHDAHVARLATLLGADAPPEVGAKEGAARIERPDTRGGDR